jgi:RNA polymerase sigma-70 factor (ECF subfamily)
MFNNHTDKKERLRVLIQTCGSHVHAVIYQQLKTYQLSLNDMEDIEQEVWFQCYQSLERIWELPELKRQAYLSVVAIHKVRDYQRKLYKTPVVYMEDYRQEVETMKYTEHFDKDITHAMDQLPSMYRELFTLKYTVGLTNKEIASTLNIKETTVRKRLSRGRLIIREILEG